MAAPQLQEGSLHGTKVQVTFSLSRVDQQGTHVMLSCINVRVQAPLYMMRPVVYERAPRETIHIFKVCVYLHQHVTQPAKQMLNALPNRSQCGALPD
jgi:hypothetical protein